MNVKEAYDNLEKIITYGFLTVGITIDDMELVFKNISDQENMQTKYYRPSNKDQQQFCYQLALSSFAFGGDNILKNREEKIPLLIDFYYNLPGQLIVRMVSLIQELNQRYLDTLRYLEGFSYTARSRFLWESVGQNNLYRQSTGITGIEAIGINSVQQNWVAINKHLDEEDQYRKDFSLSILVASSWNGKGAKVLQRNFEARQRELEELRESIAEYGYDKKRVSEEKRRAAWTAPVKGREDLVRELYRQMRGEKDKHDLFIESWIARQKELAEKAKRQAQERQKIFREKLEGIDLTQIEPSRPVSLEEIQKVQQRDKGTQYMSSYQKHEDRDRYIKKVSARVIRPTEQKR